MSKYNIEKLLFVRIFILTCPHFLKKVVGSPRLKDLVVKGLSIVEKVSRFLKNMFFKCVSKFQKSDIE